MDILDLDSLFAQLILGLGAALVLGNGFALWMARRGVKPKGAQGELRRGRAWFLLTVGAVITAWGTASLFTGGGDQEPAVTTTTAAAGSTSTSTSPTVTTTLLPPTFAVEGALPDGRAYVVSGLERQEEVRSISAAIEIYIGPEAPILGITTITARPPNSSEPTWVGDILLIPGGRWTVSIDVYEQVQEMLGDEFREVIESAIRVYSVLEMPVFDLSFPLSFPTDREIPLAMEVAYETFVIRRLCDPGLAVVCSPDEAVHAIPIAAVNGEPTAPPATLRLESTYTGDQVRFLVLAVSGEERSVNRSDRLGTVEHATNQEDFGSLWREFGLTTEIPVIDFHRYLVIFYDRAEDACPNDLLLMSMDGDRLLPKFVPPGGGCILPLIPTSYAVSVDRNTVPTRFIAYLEEAMTLYPAVEHEVDLTGATSG